MQTINIARDYTPFPGGRYRRNGKGSGQEFREKFLVPPLKMNEHLVVELDGASGYPSSFLEEAFGGLVREGFTVQKLRSLINLRAGPQYEAYIALIWKYVQEARPL